MLASCCFYFFISLYNLGSFSAVKLPGTNIYRKPVVRQAVISIWWFFVVDVVLFCRTKAVIPSGIFCKKDVDSILIPVFFSTCFLFSIDWNSNKYYHQKLLQQNFLIKHNFIFQTIFCISNAIPKR